MILRLGAALSEEIRCVSIALLPALLRTEMFSRHDLLYGLAAVPPIFGRILSVGVFNCFLEPVMLFFGSRGGIGLCKSTSGSIYSMSVCIASFSAGMCGSSKL